ncbi:hypothetical protein ACT3UJ_06500 [Halomonas sp. 86]|uniref:hypothetical protein n=1 Tax=unclassified Halomonas TaxID=2609666 RepID=UPI0040335542
MKSQFSITYLLSASLIILSGILGFVQLGLLDIPGRTAHNVYLVCWALSANMLITNLIKRSRLAVITLICGWLGATVYMLTSGGSEGSYGMTIVFGLLLISSFTMLNFDNIHISAAGGSYRRDKDDITLKNSWPRSSHKTSETKGRDTTYDDAHRILPGDTFRFEEGPRWQRTYGEW